MADPRYLEVSSSLRRCQSREPFVRRFFGGSNPIGKQLRIIDADATADEPWREIVGVVPDLGLSAGDPALAAGFYIPLSGDTAFSYVAVRVPAGVKLTDNALRAALVRVDPRTLVRDVIPIESVGAEDRAVGRNLGPRPPRLEAHAFRRASKLIETA